MHENFCEQHVKKCDICGEVINKEEEEEHIEETHSMKKCEICGDEFIATEYFKHRPTCVSNVECIYCKNEFKPKEVIRHQMNCEYNMYQCSYCYANIANKDKIDHQIFCGSKTEKCKICGKYVMLNKMDFHISMDCHPEEVPISKQIDINNIPIKKRSNAKPVAITNTNQTKTSNSNPNTIIEKNLNNNNNNKAINNTTNQTRIKLSSSSIANANETGSRFNKKPITSNNDNDIRKNIEKINNNNNNPQINSNKINLNNGIQQNKISIPESNPSSRIEKDIEDIKKVYVNKDICNNLNKINEAQGKIYGERKNSAKKPNLGFNNININSKIPTESLLNSSNKKQKENIDKIINSKINQMNNISDSLNSLNSNKNQELFPKRQDKKPSQDVIKSTGNNIINSQNSSKYGSSKFNVKVDLAIKPNYSKGISSNDMYKDYTKESKPIIGNNNSNKNNNDNLKIRKDSGKYRESSNNLRKDDKKFSSSKLNEIKKHENYDNILEEESANKKEFSSRNSIGKLKTNSNVIKENKNILEDEILRRVLEDSKKMK